MNLEKETLFENTLRDLETRLAANDPYEILGVAGLIRRLLLDDHPLVDQVNRKYKMKITFEIGHPLGLPPGIPAPDFFSVQDGIDPDTARPGKQRVQVSRDQFFKAVLSIVDSHEYTLRDIVLFEANVMGAIHAGSPKRDKEKALHAINSTISVGGCSSSLRQLKGIGRVVLKALLPLRQATQVHLDD